MPTESVHTLFKFDELSDSAKGKARDWYREGAFDYDWWESVYEDAAQCGEIIGIDIRQKPIKTMGGGTRMEPAIYFSGFCHQGQGSSFNGTYSYAKGSVAKIKQHAPQDKDLHAIAEALYEAQRHAGFKITADIRSQHDTGIRVECDIDQPAIEEALNDFNHWIFKRLEEEFNYQNSDEQVDDAIRANEYTFDAEGNRDD